MAGKGSGTLKFIAALLIVASVVVIPELAAFRFPSMSLDEGFMLELPARILAGALPNRDYMAFHGPGAYYLMALSYQIFGASVLVERVIGIAYHMAIALGVFLISSPWGLAVATMAGILSAVMLTGLSLIAFAWLGMLGFFLWSIYMFSLALASQNRGRIQPLAIIAGLLGGLAITFRLETSATLLISLIPLLLIANNKQRCNFVGGLALGLTPLVIHCVLVTPAAVLENLFHKVQRMASYNTHVGVGWTNLPVVAFVFPTVSAVIALVAGVRSVVISPADIRARTLLSAGLLSIGILPQFWQFPEWNHALQVVCITGALLPTALISLLPNNAKWTVATRTFAAIGIAMVVLASQWAVTRFFGGTLLRSIGMRPCSSVKVVHRGRDCIVGSAEEADALISMLGEIDRIVPRQGKIFVFPRYLTGVAGTELFLYFLLPELTPASYWMYLEYDTAMPENLRSLTSVQLARDLTAADAIILRLPKDDAALGSAGDEKVDLLKMCPGIQKKFFLSARIGPRELYLRSDRYGHLRARQ